MENQKSKDDFWDISSLIPKTDRTKAHARFSPSSRTEIPVYESEIKVSARYTAEEKSDTVITRYISPHTDEQLTKKDRYDFCESYTPENSLIHLVTLKKLTCAYPYYGEFLSDAIRYRNVSGEPCDFVPFFSYVPQYNQMSAKQLAYYFWFRDRARKNDFLKTDYSYLLLYVYELLNLGNTLDVKESQTILTALWNAYHKEFPAIAGKLADWICDFSLIHRLPPPANGSVALAKQVLSLKEFYIAMPEGDLDSCTRSLLRFCCSYDYKSSKFYKPENAELFDRFVFGAVREAIAYYSKDGRILSSLTNEDSRLIRDVYVGAVCVAKEKYRIELEYCSFSRSNELRFLVGDIVKYAENQLRGRIGVKSRMSVYSIPLELKGRLDAYADEHLPVRSVSRIVKEKQEYEALYDQPKKPFSLSEAKKIEADSWSTTEHLIVAFESEEVPEVQVQSVMAQELTPVAETTLDTVSGFGAYLPILMALSKGKETAVVEAARARGTFPDVLVDRINELAFDIIGDTVVEEADGGHRIIEEYKELFE